MRYITNPTCQSDADMREIFKSYLSDVLNSLHHEPIRLVGGRNKIYAIKLPFYIHLCHLSTTLILYAIYIQICCVSGLGVVFSSFVTV
jgi:hypothetical protein